MKRRRVIREARERLVLSHVRSALADGEQVEAWAHVLAPRDGGQGIVAFTQVRCFVHWTGRDRADVVVGWESVQAWELRLDAPEGPVLSLEAAGGSIAFRLPASSKARARKASALLEALATLAPPGAGYADGLRERSDFEVPPQPRGLRGHTRRVAVTVAGVAVILLGLLFASPFVPGPGMLTILAGLAILAREYDWAKDAHHWMRRKVDRVLVRWRERREQRRAVRRG